MTAAIARMIFPRASATSIANIDTFVTVALFSGVGLLLSLSISVDADRLKFNHIYESATDRH